MLGSGQSFCTGISSRSYMPSLNQRMNLWVAFHQSLTISRTARHFARSRWRQKMAQIVWRRFCGATVTGGRHTSTSGSITPTVRPSASRMFSQSQQNAKNAG